VVLLSIVLRSLQNKRPLASINDPIVRDIGDIEVHIDYTLTTATAADWYNDQAQLVIGHIYCACDHLFTIAERSKF
jgi:hypothetical protein